MEESGSEVLNRASDAFLKGEGNLTGIKCANV